MKSSGKCETTNIKNSRGSATEVVLLENNTVINARKQVCDVLNNFYINVVGSENQQDPYVAAVLLKILLGNFSNHPSVIYIKRNFANNTFNFHNVTGCGVYKILKGMKANKGTGSDNIPSKLLTVG